MGKKEREKLEAKDNEKREKKWREIERHNERNGKGKEKKDK